MTDIYSQDLTLAHAIRVLSESTLLRELGASEKGHFCENCAFLLGLSVAYKSQARSNAYQKHIAWELVSLIQ